MANGILVVMLPSRGALSPASFELLGAGQALAAALGQPLIAAIIGKRRGARLRRRRARFVEGARRRARLLVGFHGRDLREGRRVTPPRKPAPRA